MKKCLNCGYERQPEDEVEFISKTNCPMCHISYEKAEASQRLEEAKRHYNWGYDAFELGLYEIAIDEYTTAIQLNPSYAKAYTNRGIAYRKLKRHAEAMVDLKAAAQFGSIVAKDHFLKQSSMNKIVLATFIAIVALIIISILPDKNQEVKRQEMIAADQERIQAEQVRAAYQKKMIQDVLDSDSKPVTKQDVADIVRREIMMRPRTISRSYDSISHHLSDDLLTRSSIGMGAIADEEDDEYKYRSMSGTKYKYDLSNPSDRIRYEVDPASQIRDSVNSRVKIDRSMGQYGGGAK